MVDKYIDADTFRDFKANQEVMIQTLNHNFTKLTETVVEMGKMFTTFQTKFAELLGSFKVMNKLVWWILGLIAAFVVTVAVGMAAGA